MVGISLRAYWEQTESEFNELHKRLQLENRDGCFHYMHYRDIVLSLVDAGKEIENVSVFSLKSAGGKMASLPLEFGPDELPDPTLSYAVREFSVAYHSHLVRFISTEFSSPSHLINLSLPGQKPRIEAMANVLISKIAAVKFEEKHCDNKNDQAQNSFASSNAASSSASSSETQVTVPHLQAKSLLMQSNYFTAFKAKLNAYILNFTVIPQNNDLYDAVAMYLESLFEMGNEISQSDIINYQNFKGILVILGKLREHDMLINSPGSESEFVWLEYLEHYKTKLLSILSGIRDQLEGLRLRSDFGLYQSVTLDTSTHLNQLVCSLESTLHSVTDHIQHLEVLAKQWHDLPRSQESKPTPSYDPRNFEEEFELIAAEFVTLNLEDEGDEEDKPSQALIWRITGAILPSWGQETQQQASAEISSKKYQPD